MTTFCTSCVAITIFSYFLLQMVALFNFAPVALVTLAFLMVLMAVIAICKDDGATNE